MKYAACEVRRYSSVEASTSSQLYLMHVPRSAAAGQNNLAPYSHHPLCAFPLTESTFQLLTRQIAAQSCMNFLWLFLDSLLRQSVSTACSGRQVIGWFCALAVMSNDATIAARLPFSWADMNASLDSTSTLNSTDNSACYTEKRSLRTHSLTISGI